MNVVVNGLMTNYQKVGSGKVILCLPGWGDSAKSFSKLAEKLQDDYTVLALDLPGFGGSQAPDHAWGLEDYAEFIAAWLKKINARNLHAIIGHSYGGAAAIIALASGKVGATKLILVASAGIRNKKTLSKKIIKGVVKVGKVPLYLLPSKTRRRARAKVYETLGSDMLLLPHMEMTFKRIIGEDVQAAAHEISLPTLLIYGSEDKDTPVSDGRTLARAIKNSELHVIESGHFLHQEQPDKVAQLIVQFLGSK